MSEAAAPSSCPACARPVATTRPHCFYCGAELHPNGVAPQRGAVAIPSSAPIAEGPDRTLLVLDCGGADAVTLVAALGWTRFEAEQRIRRGADLLRVTDDSNAAWEQQRLAGVGVRVWAIPEREARAALHPLMAVGGSCIDAELNLDTEAGRMAISPADLILVVKGPIVREYQTTQDQRRIRTATLEPGFRFHLHRRGDFRPIEIDPAQFRFSTPPVIGSSRLTLFSWIASCLGGVPTDDSFRSFAPALAPASGDPDLASSLLSHPGRSSDDRGRRGGGSDRKRERSLVLDDLRHFRFFSGWRGAVERRKPG